MEYTKTKGLEIENPRDRFFIFNRRRGRYIWNFYHFVATSGFASPR
jgi:hypothetical protein